MMWPGNKTILLSGATLLLAGVVCGQAPPGPLTPPPASASNDAGRPAPPKPPAIAPRKTFAGDWKFNREDSDDPHQKIHQARGDHSNTNGPQMGTSWPGGGMGGGYPGSGGGRQRYPQSNEPSADQEKMQNILDPTIRLSVEQNEPKAAAIEFTGDQGLKTVAYTDGRRLEAAPKGTAVREVAAHWDGGKLISEETVEKKGSLTRTFQLSPDGLQLWEDVHLNLGKKNSDVTIHYVYDAVNGE